MNSSHYVVVGGDGFGGRGRRRRPEGVRIQEPICGSDNSRMKSNLEDLNGKKRRRMLADWIHQ